MYMMLNYYSFSYIVIAVGIVYAMSFKEDHRVVQDRDQRADCRAYNRLSPLKFI